MFKVAKQFKQSQAGTEFHWLTKRCPGEQSAKCSVRPMGPRNIVRDLSLHLLLNSHFIEMKVSFTV